MKNPSIQLKIQVAVITLIITTLSIAAVLLYLNIQKTFQVQAEKDLAEIATLVARKIEVDHNEVVYHWFSDIQQDPISKKKSFIQSWGPQGIKTLRSPALGDMDLPQFYGTPNEPVYRDVTLPHHGKTHRGRAIGLLVTPNIDRLPSDEADKITASLQPHTLVVAIDIERHHRFLENLRWGIFFTLLVITIFSALIIHFILKSALFPIQNLAIEIRKKNIHSLDSNFIIQPKFPSELKDLVIQYNDLIQRIEISRTQEKNFSSYVAHELRTPLAGISTTLELALNRPRQPNSYQKSISEALHITDSIQRLIERLKTLTILQTNRTNAESETIEIHSFLHSLWDDVEPSAHKRGLQVIWKLQAPDDSVQSDQHMIYMLIHNLIENAITYAPPESSIQIETQQVNQDLQLSISNPSNELTADDISLMFDPFFRKDAVRSIDGRHFGMGLSICREISRTLHSDLSASLSQDHQFTIQCSFPLVQPQ